jgi:hypothetical protein
MNTDSFKLHRPLTELSPGFVQKFSTPQIPFFLFFSSFFQFFFSFFLLTRVEGHFPTQNRFYVSSHKKKVFFRPVNLQNRLHFQCSERCELRGFVSVKSGWFLVGFVSHEKILLKTLSNSFQMVIYSGSDSFLGFVSPLCVVGAVIASENELTVRLTWKRSLPEIA